ncbi:MAG TPA: MATE family efflux transporter [bacterium]|nr:MATE family efflux transporter [Dictyoglomota bacterium]HHV80255.1 MATE family efflux transporter [bacterium]HOK29297.1 MATE family efflux transporter [bacterium]HOL54630.1 MATE family efflux transporter [bacterium]HOP55935.1 MATE family efflux transporter [bacterium]
MNKEIGLPEGKEATSGTEIEVDSKTLKKNILELAIPATLEQILIMIVGVVSTILVGRLGKEAISSVGLVNNLTNFVLALFTALSTGSTVLVARLIGEGNIRGAKEAVRQSLMIAVISSILVTFFCYIYADKFLELLFSQADITVVSMALQYFRITLYSFPLLLINTIVSGILRGAGDTRTPMKVAYIVNIVNVVLSFILIFGLDLSFIHIKPLGLIGAGMAVTVSRAIGGILILIALFRGKTISFNFREKFTLELNIIKRILRVGIPAALEQFIMQGGFLLLQVIISGMGTAAIAIYQIGMSINNISFMPVWGFSMAATTLVGQNLGASRPDLAEEYVRRILKIGMLIVCVLGSINFIFSSQLVSIYSPDAEMIQIGNFAIKILSLSLPFSCLVSILSASLRGAGDIIYTTITTFIGIWGFRLTLVLLFSKFFNLNIYGVWIAVGIDFAIRGLLYLARFKRGNWKKGVV